MVILELKDVYKQYSVAKNQFKTVLNGINLTVNEHDFISLIGPSGCGKSTLLRIATGEDKPSKGSVKLNGKIVDDISTEIGIVYQKYSLFSQFTVKKNILLGAHLRVKNGENMENIQKDFDEMAKLFGVGELLDKYPFQLSGGQQQRVSIIQSLIDKPKILFMDEAFGALDPFTKMQLKGFIDEYWKKNETTIIFITHNLEDAITMGNRVILLSQYYKKADGEDGSKIILDIQTPLNPTPIEKEELVNHINKEGFDPSYIKDINLDGTFNEKKGE